MTREEIVERVQRNLANFGIRVEALRVQQEPYGGWVVAVVSNDFDGLPPALRRKRVLEGLEEAGIEWADLLTPAELEWSGGLPSEESEERLPLWPEALARGTTGLEQVRFPSDEDEDLDPPLVATFYSLRGGVGRSTALAYTARLLAAQRKKVVCVDMDLEAPGLTALFGCEDKVEDDQGIVRLLLDLDQGGDPDVVKHLVRVTEEYDLYVVPAGKVGPNYARQLRLLDPNAWYREEGNPLRALMRQLRTGLPFTPDAILVDARTGITPMSGPLLFELADIAVIVFFPHPQARRGTEMLVHGLLSSTTYRDAEPGFVPEVRFIVSPIPAVRDTMAQYERRALAWVADWLSKANDARHDGEYIDERDITLIVPYREEVAASDSVADAAGIEQMFESVRDWVLRFLPSPKEQRTVVDLEHLKPRVLEELSFSAGTAEVQENFLDNFVQTEVIREAIKGNIPLVLGRKGSGKTAVFRWLLESKAVSSIVGHAPAALKGSRAWLLSSDGFREIEQVMRQKGIEWRTFWALYICVALQHGFGSAPPPDFLSAASFETEIDILNALEHVGEAPRGALEVAAWLQCFDEVLHAETLLLFDGLDAGFGNTVQDRQRRREAVEGLFGLWMDRGQGLSHLRFKILLREDIWRQLRFENKSHLYGRSVLLKWPDQATYFKVALKQAMRASSYQTLLKARPGGERLVAGTVDDWSSEDVWEAWTVLVGERMKGGKTAFTRNWVWNRLADANDDHTPRHLLQLFHEAVPWERSQHQQSPYERSVIRPRGLVQCLTAVSKQALDALQEELSELEPLLDVLKRIARSPVNAHDLGQLGQEVDLAREVGLLNVYEETGNEIQRYKVPDIYRIALGMTRKGQA